ncbi:Hypothetical protein EUBREC_3372 [Agathobacter rectalis ATCC 33656]|uniref:Uncharacterized protein n=1 Tax=Agathobacter rectalis (strain ATCC 33656 / DSM 3377 / JCM 17463 / KCTC 5835 / VPI 0990) TaxID=515619 RepID=C4ZDX2_AGARV|nr:Hypothetical protein EUBREC_3372 [Agathobacter rectalis ATCC 33656]
MSGEEFIIFQAQRSRKICMRYMKPQTVIFGLTLQNIIRQNFKKTVRRGNVLRQGN